MRRWLLNAPCSMKIGPPRELKFAWVYTPATPSRNWMAIEGVDYAGYLTLTLVQRVMSSAYGGQILISNAAADLLRGSLPAGLSRATWANIG